MTNDTDTRKTYGLLGKDISYSLSPAMHNAAFRHFGIPAEYKLFDIEEKDLESFFQKRVLGGEISGFNVTVPYKVRVYDMIEAESEGYIEGAANFVGAVNTVKVEDSKPMGYNTDGLGFERALADTGIDPEGKKVFVLGAGGAGRTICVYLAYLSRKRPEKIYTYDLDPSRTDSLLQFIRDNRERFPVSVEAGDINKDLAECDFIINATPIGTKENDTSPVPVEYLKTGMSVYDLVYARETALVAGAKQKGLKASNGLGMLISQGALAFRIWTDNIFKLGDIEKVMEKAARAELGTA
jgi:shikimate dehydrogenase